MRGILLKVQHPFLLVLAMSFINVLAQPVMLTDSLSTAFGEFVKAGEDIVIFVNTNGTLSSVSIDDPFNTQSFSTDWVPEDDGWSGPEEIKFLGISPDGNLLCIAVLVSVPDSVFSTDLSIPDPIVILICDAAGGSPQVAGLTVDTGGELCFDFTQDSRLLFGNGFLPCTPDPEAYFAYYLGDQTNLLQPFDLVDLEEGSRFSAGGIIGDRFVSNPWSDLIAAGGSPLSSIADMATLAIVFQDSTASSDLIEQWIEPDLGLAQRDTTQIVRLSDGTVQENPGDPFIVLCRVSSGRYVFSRDGGETINTGSIDWSSFEVEEPVELSELAGYLSAGNKVISVDRDRAIVFRAGRGLYYYEL